MISDHPLIPSGVGGQTRYIAEALIKSGDFSIVMAGGGSDKIPDPRPHTIDPYGEDWIVYPVEQYGTAEQIRSIIWQHKPDILWYMTDPHRYEYLFQMENEVRKHVPMVYYHVWDNYPVPQFNKSFYESNDFLASISSLSQDIVEKLVPDVPSEWIPHAVDDEIFKPRDDSDEEFREFKKNMKNQYSISNKFVIFWNNRNAKRKMPGSLVLWYKKFLDKVGHDKAVLIMHTDNQDPNGQNLLKISEDIGLAKENFMISGQKVDPISLSFLYNVADVCVNISDAEGWGLNISESLSSGTPVIVNMTGGLRDQVTDGEEFYGIGIEPVSKALIGSQIVPYIYEDRICEEDFVDALVKMYEMPKKEREELGMKGREFVLETKNFKKFKEKWVNLMREIHEKHGSWPNSLYNPWEVRTI